jgi:filamentous hemagglutinin
VLDQRIMDVLAGISYCEANGGSAGCFETGQRVKFFSEAVTLAAYTALGISNLNRGNGSVKPGQGDAVDGGVPSAPNSPIVPGGGLQAHEAAGGHLIARHVGKTNADLTARLNAQPNINAASSFPDRATAERAVSSALNANAASISQFLNGSGGRLVIDHNLASPIGHVMSRGSTTSVQSSNVRIVIQRDASMPTGYRIVTGFPVP